jgi:Ca2+:H+ antiporter
VDGLPFFLSLILLLASLGAVVLVSESIVPIIDQAVTLYNLPYQLVGILLAAMILMPETVSSIREARSNRLQNALNLSFGSALATIGLTIPAIAAYALVFDASIALGLEIKDMVLFLLSLVINLIIFSTGRASVLQGICLITLFVIYLFLLFFP